MLDDFDFICYVAYGKKPLTRKERANNVKKKDFFSKYSADAQAVLDILLDKYMNQGITELKILRCFLLQILPITVSLQKLSSCLVARRNMKPLLENLKQIFMKK